MKFDGIFGDSENQIPLGTEIQSAIITLSLADRGDPMTVHDIKPGFPFNEQSAQEAVRITNLETFGDPFELQDALFDRSQVLDMVHTRELGRAEINVTSSVQRYSNGDENTGWFFFHAGSFGEPSPFGLSQDDGVEWYSSEFGPGIIPTLVVTANDVEYVFQQGLNGYDETVDTYINSGTSVDRVFGRKHVVSIDGDDASGENYGLLRFDGLIGGDASRIPVNAQIQSAKLRLSIVVDGVKVFIHDLLPGYGFDNSTTSFANFGKDPFDNDSPGVLYKPEPVGEIGGLGVTGIIEIDVTQTIQGYANGDENTGWLLLPDFDDANLEASTLIQAHEAAAVPPPTLTVTIQSAGVNHFALY